MLPRPRNQGQNGSPSSQKLWLAVAILLVPWIPLADAKGPSQVQQRYGDGDDRPANRGSQPVVPDDGLVHNLAITNIQDVEPEVETAPAAIRAKNRQADHNVVEHYPHQQPPSKQQHTARSFSNSKGKRSDASRQANEKTRRTTNSKDRINNQHILIPDDASALATRAPDPSVRAPHPPRHLGSGNAYSNAGLSSPHVARSLEDWEVEDFVLLATVDGDLYANDRNTLEERWHLEVDQPMVETKHHRTNTSILDEDYNPIDHYIWAVEPTRDGGVFVWIPGSDAGLVRTSYTMKRIVDDLAPFADKKTPVVYTGDKKTTLITLDAATGKVLKWFGSGGSHVNEDESCSRPNTLHNMDPGECSSTGTITLGRTEYTVGIKRRDGQPVATLKYSEWGPNNYDIDLLQQYHASMDNRYFASRHDGNVYAFDPLVREKPKVHGKLATPVARVFDVCRPWDAPSDSNPELVVLPQPPMPLRGDDIARSRSQSIYLDQTATGSWYVMSGRSYPLILDAPTAQISRPDWPGHTSASESIDPGTAAKALIGTHYLEDSQSSTKEVPSLPAGTGDYYQDVEPESFTPVFVSEDMYDAGIVDKIKSLPQSLADSVLELVKNPILIIVLVTALFMNKGQLRRSYRNFVNNGKLHYARGWQPVKPPADNESVAGSDVGGPLTDELLVDKLKSPVPGDDPIEQVALEDQAAHDNQKDTDQPKEPSPLKSLGDDEQPSDDVQLSVNAPQPLDGEAADAAEAANDTPQKKKKAHRGRRGGVKHRKGKGGTDTAQSHENDAPESVDDAVSTAKKMLGEKVTIEPDLETIPSNPSGIGGPVLKVGNIEVNTAEQLGSGSNGTLVFAGKFDGREVAVKRMLTSFIALAEQETQLLKESDDHPNVIRYYHKLERGEFLYIALERCQASLADVIEKPLAFRDLADAGRQDLPGVLHQITSGILHLHSLRIVHRDLKPQNILVSMGKDGKPRLLVSDFGLCKKLENEQSSFGATTGRAAGTSGWRAPELLLDDDARDTAMIDTDTQSGSGSLLLNDNLMPGGKRATRAIDIFSLGLVFYYVLTNGCHPFDCGDKYMREVNIRKDNFNLDQLDSLGDWAYEAKDLVGSMLNSDSKKRPLAQEILAHPFFWSAKKRLAFLCDVSDHFEKEQRIPPSEALQRLEDWAPEVVRGDFLKVLSREFVDSLGKQRKYTGSRLLDLLRALRNKRNHYEDMSESLKRSIGSLPLGYLCFWTTRFPNLLMVCWNVIYNQGWEDEDRFREYFQPA